MVKNTFPCLWVNDYNYILVVSISVLFTKGLLCLKTHFNYKVETHTTRIQPGCNLFIYNDFKKGHCIAEFGSLPAPDILAHMVRVRILCIASPFEFESTVLSESESIWSKFILQWPFLNLCSYITNGHDLNSKDEGFFFF